MPQTLKPLQIAEPCPMKRGDDARHWGGPWDTSFTGGSPGVSCNLCHKTWWDRDGVFVAVTPPRDEKEQG